MQEPSVKSSVIMGVCLIVSAALVGDGLRTLGRSIERVPGGAPFPREMGVKVEGIDRLNVRVENGGGGQSFRVEAKRPGD